MTEEETGVMQLQAKERQGWLATAGSEEGVMKQILLLSPQEGAHPADLESWTPGLLTY